MLRKWVHQSIPINRYEQGPRFFAVILIVREYVFYVFQNSKKHDFFTFSWNDMSKNIENVIKVSEWLIYWLFRTCTETNAYNIIYNWLSGLQNLTCYYFYVFFQNQKKLEYVFCIVAYVFSNYGSMLHHISRMYNIIQYLYSGQWLWCCHMTQVNWLGLWVACRLLSSIPAPFSTTQPKSLYLFSYPMEGRRLSWARSMYSQISEWVSSLTSHSTHNGSFRERVFTASQLAMVLAPY